MDVRVGLGLMGFGVRGLGTRGFLGSKRGGCPDSRRLVPSGERAPELFLPPGKWDLEVVANTSWLFVVHGAPLGVQILSVWPLEGGLVDLAHPGLAAQAGEGNPEEGGLFAAAPLGHNGLNVQGSLLLARGKKRARMVLFLPTASRVAVVIGR